METRQWAANGIVDAGRSGRSLLSFIFFFSFFFLSNRLDSKFPKHLFKALAVIMLF